MPDTISQDRLKSLLSYDPKTGVFRWNVRRSHAVIGRIAGCTNRDGYLAIRVDKVLHYAHRLAWLYVYGEFPAGQVDHKNGVRNDNRISNLRDATHSQNCQNMKHAQVNNQSSGFLGVSQHKQSGKFDAVICVNRKRKYLGRFETAEAAHKAYVNAKRELHSFGTI